MTVNELIKLLKTFPSDAPVVGYCERSEEDFLIEDIKLVNPNIEVDGEDTYIYAPYYCQGRSVAEEHWCAHGSDHPIVLLTHEW